MDDQKRRFDDSWIGRVAHLWPVLCGVVGIVYALVTSYNTTGIHSQKISLLDGRYENLTSRVVIIEKDLAVRGSQFTIIIDRLGKMEDKLDRLGRRG